MYTTEEEKELLWLAIKKAVQEGDLDKVKAYGQKLTKLIELTRVPKKVEIRERSTCSQNNPT